MDARSKWVRAINDDGEVHFNPISALEDIKVIKECGCGKCEDENCFRIVADFVWNYTTEVRTSEDMLLGCGYSKMEFAEEAVKQFLEKIYNPAYTEIVISMP